MAAARLPEEWNGKANQWNEWKNEFLLYLEAAEKNDKDDNIKTALLLNAIGKEGRRLFNSFSFNRREDKNFEVIIMKFDDYVNPFKNIYFERFKIMQRRQYAEESVDQFVTELKIMAKSCEYNNLESSMILSHLIFGLKDKNLQATLLQQKSLNLESAISLCRIKEMSDNQVDEMNKTAAIDETRKEWMHKSQKTKKTCAYCKGIHAPRACPAWGKICQRCKKKNHLANVCRAQIVEQIDEEVKREDKFQDEVSLNSITTFKVQTVEWIEPILVNGSWCNIKIDTGSAVNILPLHIFKSFKLKPAIRKSRVRLISYTGHKIDVIGNCLLDISIQEIIYKLPFFIVNSNSSPILGLEGAEKLNFIKRVQTISSKEIINEFKDVFQSDQLGELPYVYDIKLTADAVPKVFPARIIPKSVLPLVKEELDKLEKLGVIKKVREPTPWVNPVVIVHKPNGDIRLCMDPRYLNKYIQRELHYIPHKDVLFSQLTNSKYFTVLDASSAFFQIKLTEESSKLCTIATPFGRYSFLRLPFGIVTSGEVYQRTMSQIFEGEEGILTYIDDILVHGQTLEEHNERLQRALKIARKYKLKLSDKKLQLCKSEIKYLGYIINEKGISIDEGRKKAILEYPKPENKGDVQRFLGMITYLCRFIPNLSDKTYEMRKLLNKNSCFVWEENEMKCFQDLKDLIVNAPILSVFDEKKDVILSCDSSLYGLGSVLLQEGSPVGFASVSLNKTQQCYSQIEKELLAIVYGCEKFNYYLFARKFIIHTDHKPLLGLMEKPLQSLSSRLQKMLVRLLKYDFSLKYIPGKELFVADALSRAPLKSNFDTDEFNNYNYKICSILTMSEDTENKYKEATFQDLCLKTMAEYIVNGWPELKKDCINNTHCYFNYKQEISVNDGLLFYQNRLIIPQIKKKEVLQKLHIAHQGINSLQRRARNSVFWAGINKDLIDLVNRCDICQEYGVSNRNQPMVCRNLPVVPWQEVSIDFAHIRGVDYLILVDSFSKFLEIKRLKSKDAASVIGKLKEIFRTHGIPQYIYSDRGPPFTSHAYKEFANAYDIEVKLSTPLYPQSNGLVERTIETVKNLIIKSEDINLAILEYNNTEKNNLPPPARCLMGRLLRASLPMKKDNLNPDFDISKIKEKLKENQEKQQTYYNRGGRKLEELKRGDEVYVQVKTRKWEHGEVKAVNPEPNSYVIQLRNGSIITRNRKFLKKKKKGRCEI